ncbi:MAG: alpha/beta fold hydrolase [Planctomycetota bacterium]|jgi:pimeloyl-ACP methyl ester carboxylesterase
METIGNLRIRRYGDEGPIVIVLHGGPGAVGSAEELALGLSDAFAVIEPWQRGSGGREPLTVARHVADLHDVVLSVRGGQHPALVGESWGAMLALAYAAEHAHDAGPIILVGCGTFDKESRAVGSRIRDQRIAEYIADHPEHTDDLDLSVKDRIMKWHDMTDNYEPIPATSQTATGLFDAKAHTETWEDMIRCQEIGLYPDAFSTIVSPVMMLHGAYDPHPGKMIRDGLEPYLPQLEYREFDRCGHQPAIEKFAKEEFFAVMRDWLAAIDPQNDNAARATNGSPDSSG